MLLQQNPEMNNIQVYERGFVPLQEDEIIIDINGNVQFIGNPLIDQPQPRIH